jgi:carboxypeptidase Taq
VVPAALGELRERLGTITDLQCAQNVLEWDMEVWMPPGGEDSRGTQLGTLAAVIHERQVEDRIGELLAELEPYAASLPSDHDDACLVRVAKRDWERMRKVPTALAAEMAKTQAESYHAWVRAREEDDFPAFRPWLERMIDLRLRIAACIDPDLEPYDSMLDEFEEGLRQEEVRRVFSVLQPELTRLVAEHADPGEEDLLRGTFDVGVQQALSRELIEAFGGSWDAFRLDLTVHPFQVTFGRDDIRLTTRYAEDDLNSLFTAMHECGHALYEWGSSPALDRTPLAGCVSSILHESQSRLWENVVGRSLPFWNWFYPRVQQTFPAQLADVPLERFHRTVNRAQRTFVRVDADETSYGLHIILRTELERELVSGDLAAKDLPDAWNARFEELLGIPVPNDRLGVLQDSHWSGGSFGYFPTYLLGSVLSVQVAEKAREAIPGLDEQWERGEFAPLHEWLRENLYSLGSKFAPSATIERVVGGPIDPEPYLAYLESKLTALQAA